MKKIILLLLIFISELAVFSRWASCWLFQSNFYFTFQNLTTNLLIASNEEKGLPIFLIRLLHNKITGFIFGVGQTFFQYVDVRFLGEFIGMAGTIGFYLGVWYFVTQKNKKMWGWVLGIITSMLVFLEMIFMPHLPFFQRITPLFLLLAIISLYGFSRYLGKHVNKLHILFVGILIIISFLAAFLFPHSLYLMCLKV